MRELRALAGGDPLRMFYAFDSRRAAILLAAGDKTGDGRWYQKHVPIADTLFAPTVITRRWPRGKKPN